MVLLAKGGCDNHSAVRSLFLEMVYDEYHGKSWEKAVAACAKQLKSLQHISISIDLRTFYFVKSYAHRQDALSTGFSLKNVMIPGIITLKKLSLKTVAVVISDQEADDHNPLMAWLETKYRCTLDEKKELARYVKEVLLKPIC